MLKVKSARTVGFVAAAALLLAGLAPGLWPTGAAQAQAEEPPPVANLKCEAKTDQVRFSWDIPQWSGGEIKWYDVEVTLPNGNRFSERRPHVMRSRTDRGNWQIGDGTRIAVKALYDLPGGERVSSAATELVCYVGPPHLLTITLDSATREYGGTDDLSYTVSGLNAGHAVEDVVVDGELSREPGDDVGTYAISLGTVSIKPAYARKYRLPKVADYTITPRPAAYTATGISKVYDGTTQGPTGPGGSFAAGDIIAGDQVTVNSGGVVFASADAGTNIAITGYSLAGADAGNYDATFDVTGNITPRAITGISDVTVHGRVTDSTTTATFDTSRAEGTGVLPGELSDFRAGGLEVTGAFPKATAGDHDLKVTYSLIDHGSFKASNYSLSASAAAATLKGQIRNPTPITAVSGVQVNARLADGTTDATFDTSGAQGAGVPPAQLADFRAGGLQVTGAFPTATAGIHDVSVTYSLQDNGSFNASKYSLSSTIAAATLKGVIRGNSALCQPAAGDDYDADGDGLIEICNLPQLNAIRHDRDNGDGSPAADGSDEYGAAFPGILTNGAGCPAAGCQGYELTADLDFDTNSSGGADAGDAHWNAGQGWLPIGEYGAVFDGNGYVISNLYVRAAQRKGLFAALGDGGVIRNIMLADVDVSGDGDYTGGLVAENRGTISAAGVSGAVSGRHDLGGLVGVNHGTVEGSHSSGQVQGTGFRVGGLVGYNDGGSLVTRSYSTASVTSTVPRVREERQRLMFSGESDYAWGLGGLVGGNNGRIASSYAAGPVSGNGDRVGGLAGFSNRYYTEHTVVFASYATGDVSSSGRFIGGLVGDNSAPITASYSLGAVSGGEFVGGLVGLLGPVTARYVNGVGLGVCVGCAGHVSGITDSYWNYHTSGRTASVSAHLGGPHSHHPNGAARTAANLQQPIGYTGIYARWNTFTDIDGTAAAWDFGSSSDFPVLSDTGPSVAAQRAQMPDAPTYSAPGQSPDQQRHAGLNDYDTDDDHLIEISSLRQLYALHVDSGGGGSVRGSWASDYHWAFPDPQDGMGCPQGKCIGYELTADLDFDTNGNGRIDPGDDYYNGVHYPDDSAYCQDWYQEHPVQSTKDQAGACDDYWGNDAQGWRPLSQLGASRSYWGVFEGNGHTIRNLYINTLDPAYTEEQLNQVDIYGLPACCGDGYPSFRGLFFVLRENAVVRNLTLENVDVSGNAFVGALAGVNYGKISNVHVTGTVSGNTDVGGLVGFNRASGVITASSVTASVEGRATTPDGGRNVGGLTGVNQGTIRASHAVGAVSGLANNTGGLVGYNDGGSIIAAYAAGPAYTEGLNAGGLAGHNRGNITASYSIGYPAGCGTAAGGLVGHHGAGAVIDSYWDTQTSGYTTSPVGAGKTTSELQTPAGYAGTYAAWNVDLNGDGNADDPWDFGTSAQYPVLKYGNLDPAGQRAAILARPPAPASTTQAQDRPNRAPTLAASLGDIVFSRDGGARQISLGGRFHDLDCADRLTVSAGSSDEAVATVSMAADGSSLTVSAISSGTAIITVTASDGRGGTVSDNFTVKVKAVPQLRTDLNDVEGLIAGHARGVFVMLRDDDEPNPSAVSSDSSVVTASMQSTDQGHAWCPTSNYYCYTLTVNGIGEGTANVTVTARDADGNQVSGAFQVSVTAPSGNDATLKALGISGGSPAFDPAKTAYTVNLPFTTRGVTLSPVATSPDAVVTVNGETPGTPLSLSFGETVVNNVVVTAADGETTKTYTVTVVRGSSDHVLVTASYDLWSDADDDMTLLGIDLPAGLSLGSKFQSSQYIYDLSVPDEMDNLTFAGIFDPHTIGIKGPPHPAFGILAVGDNLPLFEESMLERRNFQLRQDYLIANSSERAGIHRIALEMDATTVIEIGVYKTRLGDWFGFAPPDEATMDRKIVYTLNVTRGTPPSGQQGAGSYSLSPAQTSAAEGQAAELTISLSKAAPTGGVAFTVTPRYDGDATASAADVGSVTSTVTVEAGSRNLSFSIPTVSDALEETDETFTVVVAADAVGWRKDGDGKDEATVTITDDDTPGITVTADSGLSATEGQSSSYTVALESQPTKDVTITPQSADVGAVLVTPPWYKFTPFTWNTPVTFYVSGVADDDSNDESVAISHRVTTEDTRYASLVVPSVSVAVSDTTPPQLQQANNAPTVVSAIDDATITSEDGTHQASLSGVFSDADEDDLAITASSSAESVATVSVSADYSTLTVSAQARGTATITVTSADGNGGTVSDSFAVTVKAAPVVASAIADVNELEVEATHDVSLSEVFSDADGDTLTINATSSDDGKVTVAVAADQSKLTVAGVAEGTATITVAAQDSDGNTVSEVFDVSVAGPANNAPMVSTAIDDATITNESGKSEVSLSGVFTDGDGDDLTVTASSSDESVATVSVSADHSTLAVSAKNRGTATITVNASDDKGGSVKDTFTVTVKAAPVVASAIADVSELDIDATHEVSMAGVFSDADGDMVTVTQASSSDTSIAAVSAAIDGATAAITAVTVTANAEGTATITVTARDADGNTVQDAFDVTVNAPAAQQQKVNNPPTVSDAIADATIASESGTRQVSLSGVFDDGDRDALTVSASSSDESVATVSVSADYSTLTVTAQTRGTATVTVTADDGYGGSVEDTFTVRVKAAPVVASAISDVSGLEEGATRDVSLSGVFSDGDGDSLTVTAMSSDEGRATVSMAADQSALTVSGVSEGTATITVTAQDADGNRVSDAFDVTVTRAPEPDPVQLPGPVLGLELTATHHSVSVSWSAPKSGDAPDGYIVNIKRQGGGDGETRRPGANKTSLTFRDLNGGSTYQVWVRAQNEAGKGERTHATITLPVELPGPVTGLEVAATGEGVTVSWSAPETGGAPDGYIVHIRPEGGSEGSGRTKTPRAKKTSVTFNNLEAGRTYQVWVRAENEAGKGERVHASITLPEAEPPPDQGEQGGGQQQDGQSGQ